MRLRLGNKPAGKAGARNVARNVPVQCSAPREQMHGTAPNPLLSASSASVPSQKRDQDPDFHTQNSDPEM